VLLALAARWRALVEEEKTAIEREKTDGSPIRLRKTLENGLSAPTPK
jgi:hypothetical protein